MSDGGRPTGRGDEATCMEARPELAEVALGTLTGEERAWVLAHVAECPACASELERLSAAADRLSDLAPRLSPPPGFTETVGAAMLAERRHSAPAPPRRRGPLVAAAAALAVVALGAGVGVGIAATGSSPASTNPVGPVVAASLWTVGPGSHQAGEVAVTAGTPGWVLVTAYDVPASGTVTCEVSLRNGRQVEVGTFAVTSGPVSWGTTVTVPVGQLRTLRVVDDTGRTVASASFA